MMEPLRPSTFNPGPRREYIQDMMQQCGNQDNMIDFTEFKFFVRRREKETREAFRWVGLGDGVWGLG